MKRPCEKIDRSADMTSTGNQTWVAHIEQNGLSTGKQQTDFSFKPLDLGFDMVTIPLTAFERAKIFFIMYRKLRLKLAFQTAYDRFLINLFSKMFPSETVIRIF